MEFFGAPESNSTGNPVKRNPEGDVDENEQEKAKK
jgi:hypothetical protein